MGQAITKENAREMGAKANRIRWERWREAKEAAKSLLDPIKAANAIAEYRAEDFAGKTLQRIRKQIALVQDQMDSFLDTGETKPLKELSDCLARLAEIERQLAGRPLPGSLRPKAEKSRRIANTQSEPDEV